MPVCPECGDAHLTQQVKDKRLFKCQNPKCPVGFFTLIDRRDLKENDVEWLTIMFPRPVVMKAGQSFADLPEDIKEQVYDEMKRVLNRR